MDNLPENFENEHPQHAQFLLCVEGELAPKEAAKLNAHLNACWMCRARVKKIQETIHDITEFEGTVSNFHSSRSGQNWGNFDSRLHTLAQEIEKKSLASRFFGLWKQTQKNFSSFNFTSKLAASSFAVLLIFAIFYQFVFVSPVSASEIFKKARTARAEKLKETSQPVVYQKFKVSKQDESAVLEVWNEIRTAKNKKNSATNNGENSGILSEYEAAMTKNGLDSFKPLSAEVFESWHNRFAEKAETVEQTRLADGANAFELTTVIKEPRASGEITRASLVVRKSDWHPVSQTIAVKTDAGEKAFAVSELEFRVLARDTLAKNFFGEEDVLIAKETTRVSPNPNVSPNANASPFASRDTSPDSNIKSDPSPNSQQATADLEVEVLNLLSQAKADLGEQITVARENGLLNVRGIVETPERKKEILNALSSVRDNPAVRIEINTVAEALVAEKSKRKQPAIVEKLQTETQAAAAENDLIEHFGSMEAARSFAASTVNRSGRAMNHAYALKRLIGQFKPEELQKLSPEAHAKWLGLVNRHARAFQAETAGLRSELEKVFGTGDTAGANTPPINSINDMPRAVEALLNLAATNDRVIRSAMTVSAGGTTRFSTIKTAQFRQSLKGAENLASKLQTIK